MNTIVVAFALGMLLLVSGCCCCCGNPCGALGGDGSTPNWEDITSGTYASQAPQPR